jgi:hypothetical protein
MDGSTDMEVEWRRRVVVVDRGGGRMRTHPAD